MDTALLRKRDQEEMLNPLTKASLNIYESNQAVTRQLQEEYEAKIARLTSSQSAEYRAYCQIVSDLILGESEAVRLAEQYIQNETNSRARKAYSKFIARRNELMF